MALLLALQGFLQALRGLGFLALGFGMVIVHAMVMAMTVVMPVIVAVVVAVIMVMIVAVIAMRMGMRVAGLAGRFLVIGIVCHGRQYSKPGPAEKTPPAMAARGRLG